MRLYYIAGLIRYFKMLGGVAPPPYNAFYTIVHVNGGKVIAHPQPIGHSPLMLSLLLQ